MLSLSMFGLEIFAHFSSKCSRLIVNISSSTTTWGWGFGKLHGACMRFVKHPKLDY